VISLREVFVRLECALCMNRVYLRVIRACCVFVCV